MIIKCNDLDEFFSELESVSGKIDYSLYQNKVRISSSERFDDESRVKGIVSIQCSAIVQHTRVVAIEGTEIESSAEEYLLMVGIDCGKNYHDNSQELNGTKKMKEIREKIRVKCEELGFEIGPGIIEI